MKRLIISLMIAAVATAFGSAIYAQSDTLKLGEVVVTGSRSATDVRQLPFTVSVVERERLTETHQTSVLPTLMQDVPGLFVTSRAMMGYGVSNGGAGGLTLRGVSGGSGQLMVLIDGHPQYNGIYGHPISDAYQTLLAERVEVVRGPASMLYGSNAMGGVINIVTRGMATDGVKTTLNIGAGSWGTIQAEVSNQVKRGRFSSTVAAQYGRSDNHRPRMGFVQYGGFVKLGYELSKHWRARLDADITHFDASYPGSEDKPLYDADQWITRGVVEAAVENNYERTSGGVSVYTNFGRHKIDDGTDDPSKPTARYFRSKDALTGVSVYQSVRAFEGNRITVGVDYQHIYGNAYYTSKETGEVLETPNKQSGRSHRNEWGVYADFRQQVVSWLTLDAGVRFDHHSVTGTEWVPQFGLVARPCATGEIKASASKGFRNPTMREMYLYPPSNEELKPERLWSYELAWRQRLSRVSYGINLFYIKGDNMIQTVERKNVNTGAIENCGAELEVTYMPNSHWRFTTNHSVLHMEHHVVAAPEYKGYLGATFSHSRWHVNAGLQYIAGLFTEVGANETKENFCLLNIAVSYRALDMLTLWARGENLLAQRYEINRGYPMPRATAMAGVTVSF